MTATANPRTRMTRDNTAVLLIGHQVGLFTGVRDIGVGELKRNVVGLATAARVLGLPIVAATTLGVEVSDYATAMVEVMADNADPKANDVCAALDMPFATLMGQVATGLAR